MATDRNSAWQHPWLRVSLLLRTMLHTRWDAETWPQVRAEFTKALALSTLSARGWTRGSGLDDWPRERPAKDPTYNSPSMTKGASAGIESSARAR
jgi:hypothetical protein